MLVSLLKVFFKDCTCKESLYFNRKNKRTSAYNFSISGHKKCSRSSAIKTAEKVISWDTHHYLQQLWSPARQTLVDQSTAILSLVFFNVIAVLYYHDTNRMQDHFTLKDGCDRFLSIINGLPSQNSLMGDDCGIRVIKPRSKHNLVAVRHRLSIDLYSSNHLFCRLTKRQQYLRSSMRQTHNYINIRT